VSTDDGGLDIEASEDGAVVTLRLTGTLDLSTVRVLDAASGRLPAGCRSVVLDLSGLAFLDSTGIGALVRLRQRLESELRTMAITNPSERTTFVLELTGLGHLLS
jgi:anti-anti-sigma factor